MDNLKLYEISEEYINYLLPSSPHLFHNKRNDQKHSRKYIGVVMQIHDMKYFAPLSSFKPKHSKMKNSIDFIKLKQYAVINLNNMFPVPESEYTYIDINAEKDSKYKTLLQAEYRCLKSLQSTIKRNAVLLYSHKQNHSDSTPLSKRCNDFLKLEILCQQYLK